MGKWLDGVECAGVCVGRCRRACVVTNMFGALVWVHSLLGEVLADSGQVSLVGSIIQLINGVPHCLGRATVAIRR